MDQQRWKQIDSLLVSASELAPEECDAFLFRACAGDAELEREIRSLLASQKNAKSFLEGPAIDVVAQALAGLPDAVPVETAGLPPGHIVSHYRIERKLGSGGMGVVYHARDTRLERHVALKFLSGEMARDPQSTGRFLREARAASALNHPNIITVYDIGTFDNAGRAIDFIAMEYVPGSTWEQLVSGKGLPLVDLLHYATQVAGALAAAHAAGIVHRDVKPGNLMVNESGCVKVLDFGLAKIAAGSGTREAAHTGSLETDQGLIRGTISYMSPEQAEGKKIDARSDIFSFGTVLYEMITARHAFAGDSVASILSAILRDDPVPPSQLRPGLSRDLDRIIARCLQKDPDRRYQHAGDLKIDLQQIISNRPARLLPRPRWLPAAMGACLAVSLTAAWLLHSPKAGPVSWKLTRLTNEAGLSGSPALSPDGKLMAYSSDRGLDKGQDLYVQDVASGQTIRLTSDGMGNTTPDFSPDGARIVFRSNRDGGGIYVIPAFGGEARLLASGGLNPRFSPDGLSVAYWVGAYVAMEVPGSGTVWVVPSAGGQPHRVGANFSVARYPIWAPDSNHLLLIGYASDKAYERSSLDWWVTGINDGGSVRTGAFDALVRSGAIQINSANIPIPQCWSHTGNSVVFSDQAARGAFYISELGTVNLWETGISPGTGKVIGAPARLTTSAGNETDPSCAAGGVIAFTNLEPENHIWSLPFDLDHGTARGPLERLTTDPIFRDDVALSLDGRFMAFTSNQLSNRWRLWTRDLATGKEGRVGDLPFSLRYPAIGPSGDKIAFSGVEKGERTVYVSSLSGTPEKVCEACIRATDWSRDESKLLVWAGAPSQVNLLDLASHRQTPLLKHPIWSLLLARFSPDNQWISFTIRVEPNRARIAVAPIDGPGLVPESAWIPIATVGPQDGAAWSPDGNTLYYTSNIDGHICFWGQRLDARSRKPVGDPFAVQHLHGRASYRERSWSAAAGRIVIPLVEETGSIWTMSPTTAR